MRLSRSVVSPPRPDGGAARTHQIPGIHPNMDRAKGRERIPVPTSSLKSKMKAENHVAFRSGATLFFSQSSAPPSTAAACTHRSRAARVRRVSHARMDGGGGPDRGAPSTYQALVHHRRELLVLHHAQAAEAAPGVEPRHALRAARGGGARESTSSASLEGPPPVRTGRGSTGPASRRRTRRPSPCSRPCSRPGPSPSSPRRGTRARRSPARPRARRAPPPPARAPTRRATARCATSSPPRLSPSPPVDDLRRRARRRPWFWCDEPKARHLSAVFGLGNASRWVVRGVPAARRVPAACEDDPSQTSENFSADCLSVQCRAGRAACPPTILSGGLLYIYLWRPVVC